MADAALSTRSRFLIRAAGWVVVAAGMFAYSVGRALGTFGGFLGAQIAFNLVLALGAATCAFAWRRMHDQNPFEGRLWARLSLAVSLLFLAEAYYSGYQLTVNSGGPSSPSLFDIVSALAAVAYIALLWSMSRLRILPAPSSGRLFAGMAGQMVIVFALLYWLVARPLASGLSLAYVDPLLWVCYMVVGIAVLVGTFSDVFGAKIGRWSSWESLVAWSLVLLGAALILWPYWQRAAATGATAERYHVLPLILAASYGSAFLGGLYRLTAPETPWRSAPLPPTTAMLSAGSRTLVSTSQPLAIPVLGIMLYLKPSGSPDRAVLLGMIFGVTLALVIRTGFLSAELLQARMRTAKDPLTGALRRSTFDERLGTVIESARRTGEKVTLAVIDIDDFARTNVVDGRVKGDEVLGVLGSALENMLKPGEFLGRLGGDEFALCLRSTGLSGAMQTLRNQQPILNAAASIGSQAVTLSFGVATFPDQAGDANELLRAADGALYWAKYGGKNRVIAYSEIVMQALDAQARLVELADHSRLEVVRALAAATDARDPATAYHSRNVASLAVLLASAMGLGRSRVQSVELAAMVHDVGKIAVPDTILRKRGCLSAVECELFEEHPVTGEQIVASTELSEIAPWLRAHHERWDGRGYPDGLFGEEIPLEARILAVCDAYDVMLSGGPERPAVSRLAALQEIDQGMGTRFDPQVAEAFIQAVAAQPSLGWIEEWSR
jgi:diguanylate cyclase (GGDEF)-like protein